MTSPARSLETSTLETELHSRGPGPIGARLSLLLCGLALVIAISLLSWRPTEAPRPKPDGLMIAQYPWRVHQADGFQLLRFKDYEGAMREFEAVIAQAPDEPWGYLGRGTVHFLARRYAEAIADFDTTIRMDPSIAWTHIRRAKAKLILGEGAEAAQSAIQYLDRIAWSGEHAPNSALLVIMGYREAGQLKDAERVLARCLRDFPSSEWPYPILRYLGRQTSPAQLLASAADRDKLTEAHAWLGLDLRLQGRPRQAVAHLDWVLAHGNPTFVEYPLAAMEKARIEREARAAGRSGARP